MDAATQRRREWKPTLLGWMISRVKDFLLAPENLGGLCGVLERDGEAVTLSATPDGEPLLRLRVELRWPDFPECDITGQDIGFQVIWLKSRYDKGVHSLLRDVVDRLSRRIILLEKSAPALIATLFPRTPDGEIDWERCPLVEPNPPPPPPPRREESHPLSLSPWPDDDGARQRLRPPRRLKHLERASNSKKGRGEASARAELHFGLIPCRLHCAFCTRSLWPEYPEIPELFWASLTYRAVLDLPPAPFQGIELRLVGSEPAAHPDLCSLLHLVRLRGYGDIQLYTSIPESMTPERIASLVEAGLGSVAVPLYGISAETHDSIVGKAGHFQRVLDACDCFRRNGAEVWVHSVPLKQNLRELAQLPDFVRQRDLIFRSFDMPRKDGPARLPYGDIVPRISELPKSVTEFMNLRIPCLGLGEREQVSSDILLRADSGSGASNTPETEFAPICSDCLMRHVCSGLPRGYLDVYGIQELKPIRRLGD